MKMQSSRRSAAFGLCLVAALVGAIAPAFAQDRAEAKRLYAEGKQLRLEGKLVEATDRLRRAHDLAPTPVTRLELARALEARRKLVEAHALLSTIPSMPFTPTETQKGRLARDEARSLAAAIAPRIPKAIFVVVRATAETEVAIDGQPLGKELLSGEVPLDPGDHKASARQRERVVEQAFTLAEGDRRTLELKLPEPEPQRVPPAPPVLVEAPLAAPAKRPVEPPRIASAAPAKHRLTPVVPAALAIAGIGIVAGAVTGSIALAQAGKLHDGCTNGLCPPKYHDLLATHQAVAATSTVAFSLAGAAAAVGVVAWIVDASSTPAHATIGLRWAGMGLAVEGTW
jgi:hypothetical protein